MSKVHITKRLEWAKNYVQQDFSRVIFSDEARVSLDGPDKWQKGWILKDLTRPITLCLQKQGGSVMIWACIINDTIIGPFRVPDGLKLTSKSYVDFLKNNLLKFYENFEDKEKNALLFMHDNAPAHAAKNTKQFLKNRGIKTMKWPPNSPDLNPIENFWGILKTKLYEGGKKYKSKNELWTEIFSICSNIEKNLIKKLTSSTKKKNF